jgi:hypothetical protein
MTIERFNEFCPGNRYLYDFRVCTYEKGWAQIDTRQDAAYYGSWTNPVRREIFTYCEGCKAQEGEGSKGICDGFSRARDVSRLPVAGVLAMTIRSKLRNR